MDKRDELVTLWERAERVTDWLFYSLMVSLALNLGLIVWLAFRVLK